MDDKGRFKLFFWRINLLDFVVLVLFISLMPIFYFGWKVYNRPPPVSPIITVGTAEYKELKVKAARLDYLYSEHKRLIPKANQGASE